MTAQSWLYSILYLAPIQYLLNFIEVACLYFRFSKLSAFWNGNNLVHWSEILAQLTSVEWKERMQAGRKETIDCELISELSFSAIWCTMINLTKKKNPSLELLIYWLLLSASENCVAIISVDDFKDFIWPFILLLLLLQTPLFML